jgi:SAM-dependent methyltransferase
MSLSQRQWQRIHDNQAQELKDLISDADKARRLAHTLPYSRIGSWLPISEGETVLELGCGPGRFVAMLAQLGYKVTGVDSCAAASFPTWETVRTLPNVALRGEIRAERLPFDDASFDHVACMGALLYFEDPDKAISEIHRVTKPHGKLIVRTVNRENLYTSATGKKLDPASHNLYSQQELSAFLERSGFRVEESFTYGFWPPFLTQYWWYLVNTSVSDTAQRALSSILPARRRINITAFAQRRTFTAS